MVLEEFTESIGRLATFYGKPTPSYSQREAWLEICKQVPGGKALDWIERWIKQEYERFPSNPAKAVLMGWSKWQEAHPGSVAKEDKSQCPHGCYMGSYWVWKPGGAPGPDGWVVPCACSFSGRQDRSTRSKLREKGFIVQEPGERQQDAYDRACRAGKREAA
jgi:hypothetical protein